MIFDSGLLFWVILYRHRGFHGWKHNHVDALLY